MSAVYGLYGDGDAAQHAVDGLRAAGYADRDITVISSEPFEDREFSAIGKATWMWYLAAGGGLVGLALATWLTRFTQTDWPIVTGNMPIASWWTNLIVMFELTMLGAILATAITLVVSGRLLRRRPALYDPEVSDGKILVGVEHPLEEAMATLERALAVGPDVRVKRI